MPADVGRVVHGLRQILSENVADLRDAELLGRFMSVRDEAAFAILVDRHAPMVLGVCRRVLHCTHDAEDALQATFLVLARRAAALRKPDSLAGWLHGVALRVAQKMKTQNRKRRQLESSATPSASTPAQDPGWRELRDILDRELDRLPDAQRQALVLCDLQGLSQAEAARQLGWPRGTLKRRLERGRHVLKVRLTRRGLMLAAASTVIPPAGEALAQAVPPGTSTTLARAAALFVAHKNLPPSLVSAHAVTIAQGVLKAMCIARLKMIAGIVVLAGLLAGSAFLFAQERVGQSSSQVVAGQDVPALEGKGPPKEADQRMVIPLGRRWEGLYCTEHKAVRLVVRDEKTWEEVWSKSMGARPETPHSPEPVPLVGVNFKNKMVLAAFMGDHEDGGHSVEIFKMVENADGWTVHVRELSPPPSGQHKVTLQPFCLVVVPRLEGTITFEVERGAPRGKNPKTEAIAIRKQWNTELARYQQQGEMVVRDSDSLKLAWERAADATLPVPPLPDIDLRREMVLAVFMGRCSASGHAIKITRVDRTESEMYVYVRRTQPERGKIDEDVETYPACLAIVPRFEGKVIFLDDNAAPPKEANPPNAEIRGG
jgi:RNA polymerase sigma factor (sigma-70 family)